MRGRATEVADRVEARGEFSILAGKHARIRQPTRCESDEFGEPLTGARPCLVERHLEGFDLQLGAANGVGRRREYPKVDPGKANLRQWPAKKREQAVAVGRDGISLGLRVRNRGCGQARRTR